MNFLLFLWRLFVAIPLSICVYIFAIIALIPDPINVELLIISCSIGYLLSISTLIRAVHRRIMYRGGGYRAFMYILMLIVNAVVMPITLLISIFGRIYRLFNYNTGYQAAYDESDPKIRKLLEKREIKENAKEERIAQRAQAKQIAGVVREDAKNTKRALKGTEGIEREMIANSFYERRSEMLGTKRSKRDLKHADATSDVAEKIRSSMWRMSADRAVKKILDDNYHGDIRIDDGMNHRTFKQVALINLNVQKYALLAEYGEGGVLNSEADIFAIVPDERRGNNLILVEDAELAEKIFSVYRTLLAEKRLYNE